jgi:hypothetical protein
MRLKIVNGASRSRRKRARMIYEVSISESCPPTPEKRDSRILAFQVGPDSTGLLRMGPDRILGSDHRRKTIHEGLFSREAFQSLCSYGVDFLVQITHEFFRVSDFL